MKVTFLGTGTSQGIPVIGSNHPVCLSTDSRDKRLRSSVLIEIEDLFLVIDCGPDFRQQMLKAAPPYLSGIFFTHEHSDHTAGLDDIRPFYFKQGNIALYAEPNVFKSLQQRFAYIFETENKYPGAPTVDMHVISPEHKIALASNIQVEVIRVMHNALPIVGFRIENFVYLTDVKTLPEEAYSKLKGVDVLVINALREEDHASHLTLQEALQQIEKIQPKKAYLTHISHLLGFHELVEKNLPKNVFLAYDSLTIHL